MPRVEWLDVMAFRQIEKIQAVSAGVPGPLICRQAQMSLAPAGLTAGSGKDRQTFPLHRSTAI